MFWLGLMIIVQTLIIISLFRSGVMIVIKHIYDDDIDEWKDKEDE